jgi:t-SNARE complex subunit (syntaxin)
MSQILSEKTEIKKNAIRFMDYISTKKIPQKFFIIFPEATENEIKNSIRELQGALWSGDFSKFQ